MLQIDKIRTRILIVSRSEPNPYHGATRHMEDLICGLKKDHCEVHYLALCASKSANLDDSSVDTAYFLEAGEYSPGAFDAPVQEAESRAVCQVCRKVVPAVVIADYSWMGGIYDQDYFRENPSVKKIIFVHDLRIRIMPSYVLMGLLRSEDNPWTKEKEGKLLAHADVLLTLNDEDKRMASTIAPQARVLKMGMSVSPQPTAPSATIPGRCIYVASDLHENLFAVMWLLKYVWPLVVKANKSASLAICGSICDQLRAIGDSGNAWLGSLENLNVILEGRKDDLRPCYAAAEIALVPHWMMGGIKIKHIEALANGLAVVCTPAGADGLPEAVNHSALVAEMPPEFADHIIRLTRNRGALERMRRNSRELALRLTPASVYKEVTEYLRAM
jgi:glycosyl transferase family 1